MMTAAQIRQSYLDFFKSKQHTIVPSSSLMPDSPNLLFTNAGMNQFVPIFLGQIECPYKPGRAADTQKCIRAGGKHNDLDDVGLDTYHHTFFEMLGNWSFGDYFKKEAISWAWELIIEVWKFPAERVYTSIYQPGPGDPAERDQEAWDLWAEKFRSVGLDPDIHIVNGNKKDNFWMMGETGPCGPCTEIHVDLRPGPVRTTIDQQKAGALLVNGPTPAVIEIWNNVFIQYNANPDGTYVPLPAQHVDTGMGFERVVSIIHGTKNFTDFENAQISNYNTDVFRPIFDEIEKLSGKTYTATLPQPGSTGDTEQEKVDVAFRVIADHIRTLSFSIADGIIPGNSDRNYVLRRILRRAVRYGRTLGFTQPFFYKLVDVLAAHMGEVFPELKQRKEFVKQTLKTEEEAFNRTLDKGIALFENEAERLTGSDNTGSSTREKGSTGVSPVTPGVSPGATRSAPAASAQGAAYSRRNLPHFEKPWAIYHITFSTQDRLQLSGPARRITLDAALHFHQERYQLFAACVMPDHVHLLLQPWPKTRDAEVSAEFWTIGELMHSIKSFTAHEINKLEGVTGRSLWNQESFDRYMRSDSDLEEKYHYICRNPWADNVVGPEEDYEFLWYPTNKPSGANSATGVEGQAGVVAPGGTPGGTGETPVLPSSHQNKAGGAIAGSFAFRLYDEQGFPLDLTELMARERGLTVDKEGFEVLMEEQRAKARAAQKKTVIKLSEIETKEPTKFSGYDSAEVESTVLEVVHMGDKAAVVLDSSPFYAEMGGQLGDTGTLLSGADIIPVLNTQKSGNTWLHYVDPDTSLQAGATVTARVDPARRAAMSRHHSVTHILHWALHEVVSRDATQKGSYVGPEKLTFDFNSGALTPQQITDIERLVNERILENDPISWMEVKHRQVQGREDIMQAFGEKYGEWVRVVQIGGQPTSLNGYSMELCGGTHVRGTGEIGLFRIVGEAATGAGIRRIEAVAGLAAYEAAALDISRLKGLAGRLGAPLPDIEKKLEGMLAQQKELEKKLEALQKRQATATAKDLVSKAQTIGGVPAIIADLGDQDGDALQTIANTLTGGLFQGVVVIGGVSAGNVALIAAVTPDFTAKVQAGKIIQQIAPIVGGKGGGRPDNARGGGKDAAKLGEALEAARKLLG